MFFVCLCVRACVCVCVCVWGGGGGGGILGHYSAEKKSIPSCFDIFFQNASCHLCFRLIVVVVAVIIICSSSSSNILLLASFFRETKAERKPKNNRPNCT